MISIDVTANLEPLITKLEMLGSRQLPFSIALTLTRTAQQAQQEIIGELPSRFTIRRDWILKGVLFEKANKTTLTAMVYDRDEFMLKQEVGGTRVNIEGRPYMAIPLDTARAGNAHGALVRPKYKIGNLGPISSPKKRVPGAKAFFIQAKDGRAYIFYRERPGKRRGGRGGADTTAGAFPIYVLKAEAKYKDRFEFYKTVKKVVDDNLEKNFEKAVQDALKTAR